MKISGVYKITNTVTGDFYIGSSKDVKQRMAVHKCPSTWEKHPNNPMYLDMRKYGTDNFVFEILAEVKIEQLKEAEQQFIEKMHPIYNSNRAKGFDFERYKKALKEYHKSDKYKEYLKEYHKSDKYKEYLKEYQKSDKYKEYQKSDKCKEYYKEYHNQLCSYNGETITLNTLRARFRRAGIENPTKEAKKYLLKPNFLH